MKALLYIFLSVFVFSYLLMQIYSLVKLTEALIRGGNMNNASDCEFYNPKYCDGHTCPVSDPNRCYYADEMLEDQEEYDYIEPLGDELEMGFDPYLGCYTDDC